MNDPEFIPLGASLKRYWRYLVPIAIVPQMCVLINTCFHPPAFFSAILPIAFMISVMISGLPHGTYKVTGWFHVLGFIIGFVNCALTFWICHMCGCLPPVVPAN